MADGEEIPRYQPFALTKPPKPSAFLNNSAVAEAVSFELVRGIVIVQAEKDGVIGNFILDTGSPMMILNDPQIEGSGFQANTLHGSLSGAWKTCDLAWAGVRKFNVNALAMDISHLEYLTGQPLMGLIGYEFFGDFDLLLDFEKKKAVLANRGFAEKVEGWTMKTKLPLTMEGHIPVIEAKIGDASFRFGLDTGAGTNLLDLRRKGEIVPELYAPVRHAEVVGLGGVQGIQAADILETNIGGINYYNMRFALTDISNLRNLAENKVDGLLGHPFFQSGKFSINYGDKTIAIWE